MKYGDKNSKFFHTVAIQRRQRNKIVKIKGDVGGWIEDEVAIDDSFKDFFFEDMFSSDGPRDFQEALAMVENVITSAENQDLLKPMSSAEIKAAAFQLGKDKALGPNGSLEYSFRVLGSISRMRLKVWLLIFFFKMAQSWRI